MKKIIIAFLFISFVSCNNVDLSKPKYQPVSVISNQVSYGTSLDEFLEIAGDRAEKTSESVFNVYYKVHQYNKDYKIVQTTVYMFDKVEMNAGKRKTPYLRNISTTKLIDTSN